MDMIDEDNGQETQVKKLYVLVFHGVSKNKTDQQLDKDEEMKEDMLPENIEDTLILNDNLDNPEKIPINKLINYPYQSSKVTMGILTQQPITDDILLALEMQ